MTTRFQRRAELPRNPFEVTYWDIRGIPRSTREQWFSELSTKIHENKNLNNIEKRLRHDLFIVSRQLESMANSEGQNLAASNMDSQLWANDARRWYHFNFFSISIPCKFLPTEDDLRDLKPSKRFVWHGWENRQQRLHPNIFAIEKNAPLKLFTNMLLPLADVIHSDLGSDNTFQQWHKSEHAGKQRLKAALNQFAKQEGISVPVYDAETKDAAYILYGVSQSNSALPLALHPSSFTASNFPSREMSHLSWSIPRALNLALAQLEVALQRRAENGQSIHPLNELSLLLRAVVATPVLS